MAKLILVTAGTSALEKCRNTNKWRDIEPLVKRLNIEGENNQLYSEVKNDVLEKLKTNTQRYLGETDTTYTYLSAEIASLLAMEKEPAIGQIINDDKIVLLRSDTIDGKLCAEVNAEVIKESICKNIEVKLLPGLRVQPRNLDEDIRQIFVNQGLNSLQQEIKTIVENFRENNGRAAPCYLNITGGYKGVLPFTTVLALNFDLILVYLYEKSEKIIWIGKTYLMGKIKNPNSNMGSNELIPIKSNK